MHKKIHIREILNKEIKLERKVVINWIMFIVFGLITLFTTYMHECWRDESQAWLLVKDIPFFELIFSQLKYEGHPGVWYLILTPFAKLGFPYQIINYISWAIMMLAAYLVIFKSKIDNFPKMALLLTTPFIYYYSVIARSYSILSLLMILAAFIYGKRKEHPYLLAVLLALIINTHIIALGFVGMMILIVYIFEPIAERKKENKLDTKKVLISLSIILLGIGLFLLQLQPWVKSNQVVDTNVFRFTFEEAYKAIFTAIQSMAGSMLFYKILYYAYYALIPLMLVLGLQFFRKEALICIGTLGFEILVFAFIYSGSHTALLVLITLGCYLWMIKDKAINGNKKQKIVAIIIEIIALIVFLLSVKMSYNYIMYDIKYEFSASKKTAEYINNNVDENSKFIATYDVKSQSIIPYTNKKYSFISLETKKEFTYITWDESRKNSISYRDFTKCIDDNLEGEEPVYVLSVYGILPEYIVKMEEDYNAKRVYSDFNTYKGIVRESYVIYKIESRK